MTAELHDEIDRSRRLHMQAIDRHHHMCDDMAHAMINGGNPFTVMLHYLEDVLGTEPGCDQVIYDAWQAFDDLANNNTKETTT